MFNFALGSAIKFVAMPKDATHKTAQTRQAGNIRQFLDSAAAMDQLLRQIKTRLLICTQDAENAAGDDAQSTGSILEQFDPMEREIHQLLDAWKETRDRWAGSWGAPTANDTIHFNLPKWHEAQSAVCIAVHNGIEVSLDIEAPEEVYEDVADVAALSVTVSPAYYCSFVVLPSITAPS